MSYGPSDLVLGIVVAGSGDKSDPSCTGRVKVHVPSTGNPNASPDDYPWVSSGHSAAGLGSLDNARPIQMGRTVLCYAAPGMNGVQHIPVMAINTKLSSLIAEGEDLSKGIIKMAKDFAHPDRAGPPDFAQKPTGNNSARNSTVDGTSVTKNSDKPDVPLSQKEEINTNEGANHSGVPKYNQIKNVGTAIDEAASTITSKMNSLLPGVPFNLGNLFSTLGHQLTSELESAVNPQVFAALKNIVANSGSIQPFAGNSGFTQDTNNINPATFAASAVALLKTAANNSDLFSLLEHIQTSDVVKDLESLAAGSITLPGAFGNILINITASGNITATLSKELQTLQTTFESQLSGIVSSGGSGLFQQASEIGSKLLHRLPTDIQADTKDFLAKVGGQNNNPRTIVESTLTKLKGML